MSNIQTATTPRTLAPRTLLPLNNGNNLQTRENSASLLQPKPKAQALPSNSIKTTISQTKKADSPLTKMLANVIKFVLKELAELVADKLANWLTGLLENRHAAEPQAAASN